MQIKAGKLAFCCEDCAYYDQLYTFSATVSSYWETDYGLCTNEDDCRPAFCADDACSHFTESEWSLEYNHKPHWHPDEADTYPDEF